MSLQPVYFLDRPTRHGDPIDDAYASRNFNLCRALDMTALGVVLDQMREAGLPREQASCFRASADALLQLMRTENNRLRAEAHRPEPDQ